jgi:hypothetical protein
MKKEEEVGGRLRRRGLDKAGKVQPRGTGHEVAHRALQRRYWLQDLSLGQTVRRLLV